MASIRDVARKAGVSVSTVSYVLNGGPKPVSMEARERVQAAIRDLDYRPSVIARSLNTGRTQTIGVICPYSQSEMLTDQFFATVLRGIVNEAQIYNRDVLIFTRLNGLTVEQSVDIMLDGRTDGILMVASADSDQLLEQFTRRSFPFVGMWVQALPEATTIQIDNRKAIEAAVEHLVGLGHRRIGYVVGPEQMFDARERLDAFESLCEGLNLETRREWIEGPGATEATGYACGKRILELSEQPTAMVCFNDSGALGLMSAFQEAGKVLPRDLSVVGFDDVPEGQTSNPPLTTLWQPTEMIGRAAVRALDALLQDSSQITSQVFEPKLVVRGSTAPPAH